MKEAMFDFLKTKATAYSNLSLERPLSDDEYKECSKIMQDLCGVDQGDEE